MFNTKPMLCQNYGYLPKRRMSPPIGGTKLLLYCLVTKVQRCKQLVMVITKPRTLDRKFDAPPAATVTTTHCDGNRNEYFLSVSWKLNCEGWPLSPILLTAWLIVWVACHSVCAAVGVKLFYGWTSVLLEAFIANFVRLLLSRECAALCPIKDATRPTFILNCWDRFANFFQRET